MRKALHIELEQDHPSYQWAKRQSDAINAIGHVGTHIDCVIKSPAQHSYHVETVVLDCQQHMPDIASIRQLDLAGRALVLFTGNLMKHGYGCPEYGAYPTFVNLDVLHEILLQGPTFIIIDSYGLGEHGEHHKAKDAFCETFDCFVIENIQLTAEIAENLVAVDIEFDRKAEATTAKPCQVYGLLRENVTV